jgi:hypothetical protein
VGGTQPPFWSSAAFDLPHARQASSGDSVGGAGSDGVHDMVGTGTGRLGNGSTWLGAGLEDGLEDEAAGVGLALPAKAEGRAEAVGCGDAEFRGAVLRAGVERAPDRVASTAP